MRYGPRTDVGPAVALDDRGNPANDDARPEGETLHLLERLVLAPIAGVFRPLPFDESEGRHIEEGQVIGTVMSRGRDATVRSMFGGRLMGLLALPGERVRERQPVAWLRTSSLPPSRIGQAQG